MFGFGKKKIESVPEVTVETKIVEKVVLGDLEKVELYHPSKWYDSGGLNFGYGPTGIYYTSPSTAFDEAGSSGHVRRLLAYKAGDTYLAADGWKELKVKEN